MSKSKMNIRTGAFATLLLSATVAPGYAQQKGEQVTAQPQTAVQDMRAAAPTAPKGAHELLTPQNSVLLLIDH